jgi:hypothetical protein
LKAGTRFCSSCGAPVGSGAAPPRTTNNVLPWVAVGVAVIALVAALAATFDRGPSAPAANVAPAQASAPLPDLSGMPPRVAADSLFNRIMRAHELANYDEVNRFKPMAIQAYAAVGALDNDARYHLGLLHAVTGTFDDVQTQLDSIFATEPQHLLGILLQNTLAQVQGDQSAIAEGYRSFLDAYDTEMATGKREYVDHQRAIDGFLANAQREVGGGVD